MGRKPFGKPVGADEPMPGYLVPTRKTVSFAENLGTTDFVWMGDDGAQEANEGASALASKEAALTEIVSMIVDAHPDGNNRERRIEDIVALLLGKGKRAKGRPKSGDYGPLLLMMARRYLLGFYNQQPQAESLNALANDALRQSSMYERLSAEAIESKVRTLRTRFETEKDELLSYVTAAQSEGLVRQDAIIRRLANDLRKLGIIDK